MAGGAFGPPRQEGSGAGRQGRGAGRTAAREARPWRGGDNSGGDQRGHPGRGGSDPWEAAARRDGRGHQQQAPNVRPQHQQRPHGQLQYQPRQVQSQQQGNQAQHQHQANQGQQQQYFRQVQTPNAGAQGPQAHNLGDVAATSHGVGSTDQNIATCMGKPWEYVAPFCGAQVEGQGFFYIENITNPNAVKEKASTALISVVQGSATAQEIQQEFQDIFGNTWRCHVKQWSDKEFSMRFPNAKKIEEWAHFKSMGMSRAKAEIKVSLWSDKFGAKGDAQVAWFRVRRIPQESRSEPVLAYVGSLVGLTVEIDKESMFRQDYVRIKIACRDVTKVPKMAEGMLGLSFYDFLFEREITPGEQNPQASVTVPVGGKKEDQVNNAADRSERTPKKARINTAQPEIVISGSNTYVKQGPSLILVTPHPKSAPAKIQKDSRITSTSKGSGKLMADAMKSGNSNAFSPLLEQAEVNPKHKEKIDALNDLEDSEEEEDDLLFDESMIGQSSKHEGPDSHQENQQSWMMNSNVPFVKVPCELVADAVKAGDFSDQQSPKGKQGCDKRKALTEVIEQEEGDLNLTNTHREDSPKVTTDQAEAAQGLDTPEKDREEKKTQDKKKKARQVAAPTRQSTRMAHQIGVTIAEIAADKTKKRNLEELLKGMSKEELLQGVEGLMNTVQGLMEQQRFQQNGSTNDMLMITTGEDALMNVDEEEAQEDL